VRKYLSSSISHHYYYYYYYYYFYYYYCYYNYLLTWLSTQSAFASQTPTLAAANAS